MNCHKSLAELSAAEMHVSRDKAWGGNMPLPDQLDVLQLVLVSGAVCLYTLLVVDVEIACVLCTAHVPAVAN